MHESSHLMMLFMSGTGDETLRFWNVLSGPKAQGSVNDSSVSSMMRAVIR
jgi:WD40 repeat protein